MDMNTTDQEIRSAFHRKILSHHHKSPNTLVIDELGLMHGSNRIDIAVLNGHLHGYEIKSSQDTLARLPEQIQAYSSCFQKLSIVVDSKHLSGVLDLTPSWIGIIEATKGSRGAVGFSIVRKSLFNNDVDLFSLAHFLWRKEAAYILDKKGYDKRTLRLPRQKLYKEISNIVTEKELIKTIKEFFTVREDWRADESHESYDDLLQLAST